MDRNDLGFGSVVSSRSRARLLNRDGSFNVRREGLGYFRSLSAYHWLLGLTWPRFLLFLSGVFLAINLVFALGYYLCGPDALTGMGRSGVGRRFLDDFFFSVQTFATIGYGSMAPAVLAAHVLVVLEAATGMLLIALGTGISFARFARPRARILFSRHAVVAPYRGMTALQFRIANARRNELTDVRARVLLNRNKLGGGREYFELKLERDGVVFFPLSWTIVHPIDESSPLAGVTKEDLAASHAEVLILLSAIDETFEQTVHARSSYVAEEIEFGARFASVFNPLDNDGVLSIDVGRLSEIERI